MQPVDSGLGKLTQRLSMFRRFLMVGFVFIIIRLFELQIHFFTRFFTLGERNFLRTEKIIPPRGNILDVKGRPLATSRPVTSLYWQGSGKRSLDASQKAVVQFLEQLLNKNIEQDPAFMQAERRNSKFLLDAEISFALLSRIIEHFPQHKNLLFDTAFKRSYPYSSLACHVLGYLGSITTKPAGQMGLEKIYENELQGSFGQIRKKINSQGQQLAQEEIQKACKGGDLETTIDLDIQHLAEDVFPTEYAGVILALSPRTGALKAVVSRPAFDPNMFIESLDKTTWESLQDEKQPFLNRAFGALYPPASLFKLVTISAALETNLITPETEWECKGSLVFAGRPYHCSNHKGHGKLNALAAVAHSCNIPFYDIAQHIKIDTLADYAHRFGLGTKTNGAFPEKAGLVPTSAWKQANKRERWWPGETLSAAIGQSFLLVTPIQMACMVSAICEGFLVRPCILKAAAESNEHEKRPLAISQTTRSFLKESMALARERGTSRRLRNMNIELYAKTGTAQTSSLEKRNFGKKYREHGWIIVYIRYQNYEPLALLVLLENAGSSSYAIDVAVAFISRYCVLMDAAQNA